MVLLLGVPMSASADVGPGGVFVLKMPVLGASLAAMSPRSAFGLELEPISDLERTLKLVPGISFAQVTWQPTTIATVKVQLFVPFCDRAWPTGLLRFGKSRCGVDILRLTL